MRARLLAMLATLALASSAQAFCRTHTKGPSSSSCPESCSTSGLPIAWSTPQLTYAFNERGFPDLDDEDLRRIFAASTAAWQGVTCDGDSIGLDITADPLPTDAELGPVSEEPNDNAIVYFDQEQWDENSLGNAAYAVTKVWFVPSTGELIGADMMFNDGMGPFGECSKQGCVDGGPRVDLQNVATHEFGHFLGLAHSNSEGSTMYCNAFPRDISKRSLAKDDIAGLCEIYPPGEAFVAPAPPARRKGGGCALGHGAEGSGLLLALLLGRRRPA